MKTRKLNLAEMGQVLTRAEMKQIMAGSGTGGGCPEGWDLCTCSNGLQACVDLYRNICACTDLCGLTCLY